MIVEDIGTELVSSHKEPTLVVLTGIGVFSPKRMPTSNALIRLITVTMIREYRRPTKPLHLDMVVILETTTINPTRETPEAGANRILEVAVPVSEGAEALPKNRIVCVVPERTIDHRELDQLSWATVL